MPFKKPVHFSDPDVKLLDFLLRVFTPLHPWYFAVLKSFSRTHGNCSFDNFLFVEVNSLFLDPVGNFVYRVLKFFCGLFKCVTVIIRKSC